MEATTSRYGDGAPQINLKEHPSQDNIPSLDLFDDEPLQKKLKQKEAVITIEEKPHLSDITLHKSEVHSNEHILFNRNEDYNMEPKLHVPDVPLFKSELHSTELIFLNENKNYEMELKSDVPNVPLFKSELVEYKDYEMEPKPHVPDVPIVKNELQSNEYNIFFNKIEDYEVKPCLKENIESKEVLEELLHEEIQIKVENEMSLLDVLIVFVFLIILAYFYFTRTFKYWESRGVPCRPPTVFFGNALDLIRSRLPAGIYMTSLYTEFAGPYFGFYGLTRPFLVLKDPEIIKRVVIKDFDKFSNRFFYSDENIDPISSNSLLGIKTPHWKPLRSKLSPVFSSGKIKMLFHLINECGENMATYIKTIVNQSVEAKEMAAKYTTDVVATCSFGITANSFKNENSEFRVAGRQIFDRSFIDNMQALAYFFSPEAVKLFKFPFIPRKPTNFLRKVFTEAIRQRESGKEKRNDLIDILIELKNEEKSDDEFKFYGDRLVAQAIIFFGAGHETTSSTIAFTLHELCIHNDIQDKLRKEINEVTEKHGAITYDAVQDMKYLDMVVSETLRKYPLTPFIQRECSADYEIPETGLVIEKGTPILIPQHSLHWDPKYFPNPEKYDPERFNNKNKRNIPSYVYLPFGEGPRICIGERFGLLSTKLGLIHSIKNFEVNRNKDTTEPMIFKAAPLLQAKDGVKVTFQELH